MNRTTMLRRSAAFLGSVAFVPLLATAASAATQPVGCTALAAFVKKEAATHLNLKPISPGGSFTINSTTPVTSKVIAASGPNLSYCQVVFQLEPFMTIEVGLPLNTVDSGTGAGCSNVAPGHGGYYGSTGAVNNSCVEGNWNGKVQAIGNGGFSGSVPGITAATNLGFVGSSTDNGHSNNECNATNPANAAPYAQPNCGSGGAGFVLTPANVLWKTTITDFMDTSEVKQTTWASLLTKEYYGRQQAKTYWNGCSTGGRQGFEMAQYHPEMFDGILAGAPAFNWNRFQIGEMWAQAVVADLDPIDCASGTAASCSTGTSTAFTNAYTAANAQAVADCDANDGVVDGVINEPRLCHFDAKSMIGQTVAPMTVAMTAAQAVAINLIWDGPRNQRGQRLWGGPTYGTSFAIELSGALMIGYVQDWMYQNPSYNFLGNTTTTNFATAFQFSARKFAGPEEPAFPGFAVAAATDSTDLSGLIAHDTKLLHYRGLSDPLIVPFNSWEYNTRLLNKYGVKELAKYFRSFYYPGNGHCGGNTGGGFGGGNFPNAGLINAADLFNSLIDWVENGVAPDSVTAYTAANDTGNTTLICAYPSYTTYKGSGPITAATSYSCVPMSAENPDLKIYDTTAVRYHEVP
jgi:pimeloyl-ACP methyl ester carboxylesterase